jgi:DNA-binding winged helix-turn-helix (wHTH) protein
MRDRFEKREQVMSLQQLRGVHVRGIYVGALTHDTLSQFASSRSYRMAETSETYCFGEFELSVTAGELRRRNRRLKLQPQPFKLLLLLVRRAGNLVSRDDIRKELWPDGTFVDFDQAVNFSIKQIRDVLGDDAEHPLYIETVPKRGHRFIAPMSAPASSHAIGMPLGATGIRLEKALWTNIAELRLAETRRHRQIRIGIAAAALIVTAIVLFVLLR